MASELWQRLRAARISAGLTQEELGKRIGVTRAAISQWEHQEPEKRSQPRWEHIAAVSRVTGAPQSWLGSDEAELDDFWSRTIEGDVMGAPVDGVRSAAVDSGAWSAYVVVPQLDTNQPALLAYRRTWVEHLKLSAGTLECYMVNGDVRFIEADHGSFSGECSLSKGDVLLVDRSVDKIDKPGIYLVGEPAVAIVARSIMDLKTMRQSLCIVGIEGAPPLRNGPMPIDPSLPLYGRAVMRTETL